LLAGEGPPLLLFSGEPGIGKSRLLTETAAHARDSGWRVLSGGCDQRSGREPYAPFVELLAAAALATPRAQRARDLKECRWLARLVPEIAELAPAPVSEWARDPGQERRLMFSAVKRYLDNIAGPAGTLLVLDDLHWTGADALDLLAFLVQTIAHDWTAAPPIARLCIVGAYRSSEVSSGHPLDDLRLSLAQQERISLCGLTRFTAEEARLLLSRLVAAEPEMAQTQADGADGWAEKIIARAEGVPLYLVTFAQGAHPDSSDSDALKRADAVGRRSAEQEGIPWLITAQIRQRVTALTPEAQEALAVAALIGRVAPLTLLHAALIYPEDVVVSALEATSRAHLLEEAGGATVAYQFTHDLIRETTVRSLSKARMMLLHRRIGAALERALVQSSAAERARHVAALADHLASAGELARALPYLLEAGDRAEAVYAHAEAEAYYRSALETAQDIGDTAHEAEALEKLGGALGSLTGPADALDSHDTLERAAQAYQALGDAEGELRVLAALAGAHSHSTIERAEAALARILPRLSALEVKIAQTGQPVHTLALTTLHVGAGLYTTAGRLRDAVTLVERGVELAREAGDDAVLAWAYVCRGYVGGLSGSEGSLADFLDAVVLAERADTAFLSQALNFVTSEYLLDGQLALAKPYAERALAVAERRQVPNDIAFMRANLGELAYYRGDWDEAREHFAHAVAIQERLDPTLTRFGAAPARVSLCLLDLAQGRAIEETILRLESLLTIMRELVNHPALEAGALGEVALAERALLLGRAADARDRLAAFLDQPALAEHARMAGARVIALPTLAWAEADLGHDAVAAERLEVAITIATATARRESLRLADALRVKGLLAARQQRWKEAQSVLDECLALCRTMPYPYAEAKALNVYGQLHVARGECQQARKQYQAALAICDRLDERVYRAHVQRDLSALSDC
jgi:tetratricopeptide (TPR) repeat protein